LIATWNSVRKGLTQAFCVRAAIVTAVLYAFCSVAPTIALSFDPSISVRCLLTEGPAPLAVHSAKPHNHSHSHADGTAHHHHDESARKDTHTHDKGHAAECCGMLFLNGVVAEHRVDVARLLQNGHAFLITSETFSDRGPERINKPPIDLLSL
jgi:hypothetical protein